MRCTNCGKILPDDSAFCAACGEQIYNVPDGEDVLDGEDYQEKTPDTTSNGKYHSYYGIYKKLPTIIAILSAIGVIVTAIICGVDSGEVEWVGIVILIGFVLVPVIWFLSSLLIAPKVVLIDTVLEIKKNVTKK